jgi:hypothetical protein
VFPAICTYLGVYAGAWAQGRTSEGDCVRARKYSDHKYFCAYMLLDAAGCGAAQSVLDSVTNDVLYQLSYCGIKDLTKCRGFSSAKVPPRPGRPQYSKPRQ